VAIAEVVIRTTQHLAAVIPNGRALMLITLRYQDELRPASGLDLPAEGLKSAGVGAKEVALAKRLVDDMTERWNPAEFKDTYHQDLMARIKQKIKQGQTKEITKPDGEEEGAPRSAQIIDLAELLKKSLGKAAGPRKGSARTDTTPARSKPSLSVVASAKASAKRVAKSASRPAARRKRA
jgi:DNA end-binding protein Ku